MIQVTSQKYMQLAHTVSLLYTAHHVTVRRPPYSRKAVCGCSEILPLRLSVYDGLAGARIAQYCN